MFTRECFVYLGVAAGDRRGEGGVVVLRVRIGGHDTLAVQVDRLLHPGNVRLSGNTRELGRLANKRNLEHRERFIGTIWKLYHLPHRSRVWKL